MDNKGFISVEYIFSLFIIMSHRMILDSVAGKISQVNSNGAGYSKYVELPSDNGYFEITVEKSRLTIDYDGKKGESMLPLLNIDGRYKLISGRSYCIAKTDDGKIVIT